MHNEFHLIHLEYQYKTDVALFSAYSITSLAILDHNLGFIITYFNIQVMKEVDCNKIVFSSSATVYQPAESLSELPLDETRATGKTTNPYARSKLHVEEILQDTVIANNSISVVNLRYFNPVGAHQSGLIGEDPRGIPNNVMPYISQVAIGRRPQLNVFGNDYESPDGTG